MKTWKDRALDKHHIDLTWCTEGTEIIYYTFYNFSAY